jgi:hypothetical protein
MPPQAVGHDGSSQPWCDIVRYQSFTSAQRGRRLRWRRGCGTWVSKKSAATRRNSSSLSAFQSVLAMSCSFTAPQMPLYDGVRFSRKALAASWWSSELIDSIS